ncbi:head-tail connector protein [Comamonas sp. GB3 AK4-5]|uniref:head-tail connector protein n=1 Tax=Comamonas sp. GB3 AK4-5 TaxID=3231487 RepID=UPI00351DB5AB
MRLLVTLKQARAQLRQGPDVTADDDDLRLKIAAASDMVLDYLGRHGRPFLAEDGSVPTDDQGQPKGIPPKVQMATLVTVNYLYRERDGSQANRVDPQHGYGFALPQAATSMLFGMRRPGVH